MSDMPIEVTKFVHENINTIDDLRVLLLLCRSPDKEWDAVAISSMLYLKPDIATACLANLQAKGLLAKVEGKERLHKYAPRESKMADLVRQVVELDQSQPVTLINLVYSKPKDVQAFADAFKLTKDKES